MVVMAGEQGEDRRSSDMYMYSLIFVSVILGPQHSIVTPNRENASVIASTAIQ